MKKHLILMALLLVAGLILPACGAQTETVQIEGNAADGQTAATEIRQEAAEGEESAAEPGTEEQAVLEEVETAAEEQATGSELSGNLRVWSLGGDWFEWFSIAEKRFEEQHPEVDVSILVQDNQALFTLFPQAVQGGDPPDVSWFFLESAYRDLAQANLLEPFDDLWETEWEGKFMSKAQEQTLVGGRSYAGVTEMVVYPLLYYNKEIMDEADAYPANGLYYESNEEFLEAAQKIKDAGYEVYSVGAGEPDWLGHTLDALMARTLDEETIDSYTHINEDTPSYTDPQFVKALELMAGWRDAGIFATGFESRSDEEARSLFTSGLAAWYQSGSWGVNTIAAEEPDFEWGWMLFPQIDPAIGVPNPTAYGGGIVIPTNNSNPEAAREFAKFLSSVEMMDELAKVGRVPVRLDISDEAKTSIGQVAEMLAVVNEHGERILWADTPEKMLSPMMLLLQQLLAGQMEPTEVTEEMDKIRVRLINE